MGAGGSTYFWLGASADADRVLSPTATEPVVSAHSGNAPLRISIRKGPDPLTIRRGPTQAIRISQGCGFEEHVVYLSDQEAVSVATALHSMVRR